MNDSACGILESILRRWMLDPKTWRCLWPP